MANPKSLRPIQFHQLCAIARTVLQSEPTIDDSEWKERTKALLSKQGYDYPAPDMMARAMVQVEHALTRTLGKRPVDLPLAPTKSVQPQQADPPWQRGKGGWNGWAAMAALMRKLGASGFSGRASYASLPLATARETLAITEDQALHEFWRASSQLESRLELLKTFAEIAIERPGDWDPEAVRARSGDHSLTAEACFACQSGTRERDWHHVIQIQHGGSNTPRNRVSICSACHADVHPWLSSTPRKNPSEWYSFADCAPNVLSQVHTKSGAA
jgi:hypothetical protein